MQNSAMTLLYNQFQVLVYLQIQKLETVYLNHKTKEYLLQILKPGNINFQQDCDDEVSQFHLSYRYLM